MAPTPTLPQGLTRLLARQEATTTAATTVVVASDSNTGSSSNNGLDGGAIAGIVIGTIVGILIIWWIIKSCTKPSKPDASRQGWYDDTMPPRRSRSRSRSVSQSRHHHHHHHRHGRHHSRHRSSSRPVVVEEKYTTVPRRPSATYVYPAAEGRRSRSRSQGRYYLSG